MIGGRTGQAGSIYGAIVLVIFAVGNVHAQVRPTLPKLPYQRLDSALARMVVAVDGGQQRSAAVTRLENPLAMADRVPVTITSSNVPAVSAWIRGVGGTVANSFEDTIEAYVTADNLRDLNSLQGVVAVRQIIPAAERAVSQGVAGHNASNWHANGRLGSGVRVGIVDGGFVGFSALMGTEVPASVTTRCYSAIGVFSTNLAACQSTSDHGTAVAESLVDMAPGIQLFIANPKSNLDFRQTVDWMTSQGVRVINYSAANLWDGPGNGTSPNSDSPLKTVDAATAGGAVFIAAAGNEGTATYLGAFSDVNGNNWAEFPTGFEDNAVFLGAGERILIQLRWQDNWGFSTRDLDLYLRNSNQNTVAFSLDSQAGTAGARPFEFLTYTAPTAGIYYIGVHRFSGTVPSWIQLQNASSQSLESYTLGSIGSPAETANPGALAVGAAPWYSAGTLESFSSRGPTPDGRLKPDVVGVDRADTVTYGPGGFAGTSQATPHIAGLAALVLQQFPAYSPAQVASYLKSIAAPGYGPRPNNDWGYGLSILPTQARPGRRTPDVDGDGRTDLTVYRPNGGGWFINPSAQNFNPASAAYFQWGLSTDIPLKADFDGDGKFDLVVYRPSEGGWYIRYSSVGYAMNQGTYYQWGLASDIPLPADFDGDGRTDLVVYRPSDGGWYVRYSSLGYTMNQWGYYQWGLSTDRPLVADFDGDGRTDLVVYRPSDGGWYVRYSSLGYAMNQGAYYQWGLSTDTPLVTDFDGDGRTDLAVYRPSDGGWYIRYSSLGYAMNQGAYYQWGLSTDTPLVTDFDGDGRTDLAVYRPSVGGWYIRYSSLGYALSQWAYYQWGLSTDVLPRP